MLQQLSKQITNIIQDYHNYNGFQFTYNHIIEWVNQFEEIDREFVLQEFLHLLKQGIYFSEAIAKQKLILRIEKLSSDYKFSKLNDFLANVDFLKLQPEDKSQDMLLRLLDEELKKKYNIGITQCGNASKKYAIYIDDILATGGTIFNDSLKWLQSKNADGESNLEKVINQEKIFIISVFCLHTWANISWRLKLSLKNDAIIKKIRIVRDYEIQNHPSFLSQRLNFFYPVGDQPKNVLDYLESLEAEGKEGTAFRKESTPDPETLFSSPANRIRLENIFLSKGIEVLAKSVTLKPNHRPLGATFPSYKTFGTGTLFFTWRNISNTSPIVFWWKSAAWQPLFPLYKRGLAI